MTFKQELDGLKRSCGPGYLGENRSGGHVHFKQCEMHVEQYGSPELLVGLYGVLLISVCKCNRKV